MEGEELNRLLVNSFNRSLWPYGLVRRVFDKFVSSILHLVSSRKTRLNVFYGLDF